jgi:hypothetical protein
MLENEGIEKFPPNILIEKQYLNKFKYAQVMR